MPRVAAFPTVPLSVLLLVGLILPVFVGANPPAQTEVAKTPEPGLMLTLETVEAPGIDIRPYFTAVAAILRHSWPSKMQANLITHGEKGIVFVRAVILRNGLLQQGSPILEIPSQMAKLNDASLATVSASIPFDPLPENYKGEKLELRIVFRYAYLPDAPFKELFESAQRASGPRRQILQQLGANSGALCGRRSTGTAYLWSSGGKPPVADWAERIAEGARRCRCLRTRPTLIDKKTARSWKTLTGA